GGAYAVPVVGGRTARREGGGKIGCDGWVKTASADGGGAYAAPVVGGRTARGEGGGKIGCDGWAKTASADGGGCINSGAWARTERGPALEGGSIACGAWPGGGRSGGERKALQPLAALGPGVSLRGRPAMSDRTLRTEDEALQAREKRAGGQR
ncbi:MAG: hypothetical protein AB1938_27695, partial [Myxococcota bacterium]